jgi:flagellar basal-body rod modification protein FlgD
MAVDSVTSGAGVSSSAATGQNAAQMSSDDFYKLLIAELRYQDPMQPMDNSKMVEQVAGIRNIEASTSMTNALSSVTRQQNFGTASSLIGKKVVGQVKDASGTDQSVEGVVTGVRFESNGSVVLELDNKTALPLEAVVHVEGVNTTTSSASSSTASTIKAA